MDTQKSDKNTTINDSPIESSTAKSPYKKPVAVTHEALEVISKWRSQASELPGI